MKSCLITGGTGTLARALIPQLLPQVERLVALARHEKEMDELEAVLGPQPAMRYLLGDVRDLERLEKAMRGVEVVVHAAALKRIEQCQRDPEEALKTNVLGTMNVAQACLRAGVKKALLISTDKAVAPANLYGATKLCAEFFWLAENVMAGTAFAVVRYGNVWGSRGSVVPKWLELVASGQRVPVTDPEATRFYMTIDEAVQLVVDTLKTMRGGELVMPKLKAYRLNDLADAMGAKMIVTGLPTFEKRHEELGGVTSDRVRRLTMAELKQALQPQQENAHDHGPDLDRCRPHYHWSGVVGDPAIAAIDPAA